MYSSLQMSLSESHYTISFPHSSHCLDVQTSLHFSLSASYHTVPFIYPITPFLFGISLRYSWYASHYTLLAFTFHYRFVYACNYNFPLTHGITHSLYMHISLHPSLCISLHPFTYTSHYTITLLHFITHPFSHAHVKLDSFSLAFTLIALSCVWISFYFFKVYTSSHHTTLYFITPLYMQILLHPYFYAAH